MLENRKSELMNGASGSAMPMQAQGEVMPSGPPEPQPPTPEEEDQHKQFMGVALQAIYDDKLFERNVEMLKGGGDPMRGLASTAAQTAFYVLSNSRKRGVQFTPDVQAAGAKETFEELAELSMKAGIKDFSKDQKSFDGAFIRYFDELRVLMQQSGMINEQEAKAAMQRIQEMDENGMLDRFFRDLAERDRSGSAGDDETPPTRGLGGKRAK